MKPFSFVLLLFFTASLVYGQPTPPSAEKVLKEAKAQAAKENKKVFVIFHASWCGWCHKMDSAMSDPAVKSFFDNNYVIKHLTILESKGKEYLENPGALQLLEQYHGSNQGIPFWLVFDKNGTLLADSQITPGVNSGCPATKEEVAYFVGVLKKTSPLKEDQLDLIAKRFRQNE